jgi:hypothetical protein
MMLLSRYEAVRTTSWQPQSNEFILDTMGGLRPSGRAVFMDIAFDQLPIINMSPFRNIQRIIGSAQNGKQYLVQASKMAAEGKFKIVL